jgi:hypothetical protein
MLPGQKMEGDRISFNYAAVRSVVLDRFNPERLHIILSRYTQTKDFLSPLQVSKKENLLITRSPRIYFDHRPPIDAELIKRKHNKDIAIWIKGKSAFVFCSEDEHLNAYVDAWCYLKGIKP